MLHSLMISTVGSKLQQHDLRQPHERRQYIFVSIPKVRKGQVTNETNLIYPRYTYTSPLLSLIFPILRRDSQFGRCGGTSFVTAPTTLTLNTATALAIPGQTQASRYLTVNSKWPTDPIVVHPGYNSCRQPERGGQYSPFPWHPCRKMGRPSWMALKDSPKSTNWILYSPSQNANAEQRYCIWIQVRVYVLRR
jgi:hypothetical protein